MHTYLTRTPMCVHTYAYFSTCMPVYAHITNTCTPISTYPYLYTQQESSPSSFISQYTDITCTHIYTLTTHLHKTHIHDHMDLSILTHMYRHIHAYYMQTLTYKYTQYICTLPHTPAHVHPYTFAITYTHKHKSTCTYSYPYPYSYKYTYIYMHAHSCVHTNVYAYIYI